MAKVSHFTELECWKEARKLVRLAYKFVNSSEILKRDFGLKDQFTRASISVMNNIAEGFGRFSSNEFIRFLDIAKASCIEVESMTYVLEDINALSAMEIEKLRHQVELTKAKTSGLLKYLVNKRKASS